MKKRNEPKSKFNILDKVGTMFGISLPIIAYGFAEWYWAIITLFIIIFASISRYIYLYKKEVRLLYNDYLEIYNNHKELAKQFDKKAIIIKNQEKLITAYKYQLLELSNHISAGMLPVTKYEKAFLENLYEITLKDIEHLYKLEGDIEDGKNL